MLLQGMEGGWVVIEASHTVSSGLNVTCHMLMQKNNHIRTKIEFHFIVQGYRYTFLKYYRVHT